MADITRPWARVFIALFLTLTLAPATEAQEPAKPPAVTVHHRIEGRIQQRDRTVDNIQVRLVKMPEMRPIADTLHNNRMFRIKFREAVC